MKVMLPPELEHRRTEIEAKARELVEEHFSRLDMEEFLPLAAVGFVVTSSVPLRYRWGMMKENGEIGTLREGDLCL